MQSFFISVVMVLTGTFIHAQQLFSPSDYNAWNSSGLQFGTIPTAPGATFTQINRGSGNFQSTDPDGVMALSWNSANSSDAIATNRYFTFSVSADASTNVTVDSLLLVLKRNNSGPNSCIVQYKSLATGYVFTDIGGSYTVLNPSTNLTIIPPAALSATPTDSIVFRVVAWGGTHPNFSSFGILNGTHIYGSVTPAVASETISAAAVSGSTPLCITPTDGQAIQVDFTSTGTFNTGNNYTLELSDNTGSFSSPVALGSLSSTANSGTINATIPAGTATGNYQLRISSSDPVVTSPATTTIDVFSGLILSASLTQPLCNADPGAIDLTTAGGTAPLVFNWSNTAVTEDLTGLTPDTYTIDVTDANGCTATNSYIIDNIPAISVNETITDALCNGENNGAVSIAATGGTAGYSYAWTGSSETSNSLTGVTAGSYEVTVTDDNGCTYSEIYTISEPAAIVLTEAIVQATCATCQGNVSITVAGGNAPYTYLWDDNSGNSSITGTPGQYCVEVTDNNSCMVDSCYIIGSTTGLTVLDTDALRAYPNPASGMIHFTGTQPGQLTIRNLHGQTVEVVKIQDAVHTLTISTWESGVYFYTFQTENATIQNGRFVKQ